MANRCCKRILPELPPFKEAKRRDDFPDAFIWQTILDLSVEHKRVHVISDDEAIRKACDKKKIEIVSHGSLWDFLNSWAVKDKLSDRFAERYFDELKKQLPAL